ncbi:kelch-like protein 10 [Zootermopsis nevadensis]|uniref:kelch-like protein 10 n=1 Tax=Zootermopsis nevadensis TaxID=136037 RepID=UPI000B8E5AF8|nr:kelch-like protein 10 [Zootermopsis nevadensis]
MGGRDYFRTHRTAERYDCKTNQWSWIAPMNEERYNASATVLNDKIYVAGGSFHISIITSVEVYDPDTNRWTYVAPMLSGRAALSCVAFHGCLYALGGYNETPSELSTEKYDPAEDTWTEMPCMNSKYEYVKAEVIDDTIFMIADPIYKQCFPTYVACFNDKENRWYETADMNVRRFH